MLLELSGWLTLLGVFDGVLFYIWNLFNPSQSERRVRVHSCIGLVSLVPLLIHLLSLPSISISDWLIWAGVGFFLILLLTGMILLYFPYAGGLRYHARSFHPALLVGLLIILFHHLFD